jgi:hypothetical protein
MLGIYCPHNAPAACKLAAITLSTLGTRATYVSTGAWRTHLPRDGVTAETDIRTSSRKTHRLISVDLEATKRVASPTIQLLIELASIGRVYRPYEIRDTSASALATPLDPCRSLWEKEPHAPQLSKRFGRQRSDRWKPRSRASKCHRLADAHVWVKKTFDYRIVSVLLFHRQRIPGGRGRRSALYPLSLGTIRWERLRILALLRLRAPVACLRSCRATCRLQILTSRPKKHARGHYKL